MLTAVTVRSTDDASSKLISDFISNEPLDQVLSADAWRLDDYPPRRRLDLLARAQKTLEFTDGRVKKRPMKSQPHGRPLKTPVLYCASDLYGRCGVWRSSQVRILR